MTEGDAVSPVPPIPPVGSGEPVPHPVHGLLVTHGNLGASLIETVRGILGKDGGLGFVTNADCSTGTLRKRMADALPADGLPAFVFVDLPGGSCETAALSAGLGSREVYIVTGINLTMILEFAQNAGAYPPPILLERILTRGQRSIATRTPAGAPGAPGAGGGTPKGAGTTRTPGA